MPSTTAKRAAAGAVPQDPDIAKVTRGTSSSLGTIKTEDERRAEGSDASTAEGVGEHDDSPEATKAQTPGGTVIDAYANASGSIHDNRADPGPTLVLGQAPSAPAVPMKGSKDYNEKFHPAVPNAINRSPMIVGVDPETKKPVDYKTHADLKQELVEAEGEGSVKDVESVDGTATTAGPVAGTSTGA